MLGLRTSKKEKMSYVGNCHCKKITFELEHDPMMTILMSLFNMPTKVWHFIICTCVART